MNSVDAGMFWVYTKFISVCLAVMTSPNQESRANLLRPAQGSKCEPKIVHDPYPRVIDWGMPEDVNAGDFTFSVLESALGAGASEIQLTPVEEFGEVSVHFKIGSEYIRQQPLTQIQFGFIAILLSHIATLSRYGKRSQPSTKYFYTQDRKQYFVRFSKIRLGDATAILIRLFVTEEPTRSIA
jgi:hypothetical protein